MKFKFINNSDLYVEIDLIDSNKKIHIKPKTYALIECNEINTFYVNEIIEKNSVAEKVLGIIIAVLISIVLWFINYFDSDSNSIEQAIKFDTKFKINSELLKERNEIIISDSKIPYIAFDAVINNCKLNGNPDFTKEKFNYQLKSYNQSKIIINVFPILTLLFLFILSVCINKIIVSIVVFCIILLMSFYGYKQLKKDKIKIAKIVEQFTY